MSFDNILLDFCIVQIEQLNERIKNNNEIKITNVYFLPETTLKELKLIKQHESFKIQYESIYNQCLVLLVSYFTSTVKDLFRDVLQYYSDKKKESLKSINAELKFTFEELESYGFDLSKSVGNIIIKKKNLTFQDNIILAQAARHAIVHSLSIADEKFMNQISQSQARTLKKNISMNDELKFSPNEIEVIMSDMREFLKRIEQMCLVNK